MATYGRFNAPEEFKEAAWVWPKAHCDARYSAYRVEPALYKSGDRERIKRHEKLLDVLSAREFRVQADARRRKAAQEANVRELGKCVTLAKGDEAMKECYAAIKPVD